jgi:SagB-type dehydrogenase family enzyme
MSTKTTATLGEHALPEPELTGGTPLQQVLAQRRSRREFLERLLTMEQVSQLCWSGQGRIGDTEFRTAPSAGGLYPTVLYVADHRGVFEYLPEKHRLVQRLASDVRTILQRASFGQEYVGTAPLCVAIAFDPGRLSAKYGRRSERYCWLEAGHVAQNILLQAASMNLGSVPVGAFHDGDLSAALQLPPRLRPAYLLPVGYPAGD